MKLERINTAKGFCAKRSQRIPELHRNSAIAFQISLAKVSALHRFACSCYAVRGCYRGGSML